MITEAILRHLQTKAGITLEERPDKHAEIWEKVKNFFLTAERRGWFHDRATDKRDENAWHYWELYTFGKIQGYRGEPALQKFDEKKISACYAVRSPSWQTEKDSPRAVLLKGEYDLSFIKDEYEYELLKNDIRGEYPIPAWCLPYLSEHIGKELYVLDENADWVLVCTHENETFYFER